MAQKFLVPITIKKLSSAGSDALTVFVDGETYARIKLEAGGRLSWSDGTGNFDTNLYRSGANILKTDDVFEAPAGVVTLAVAGVPSTSLSDGAIAVDTLNDDLYFRSGGEWLQVSSGGLLTSDLDGGNEEVNILEAEVSNLAISAYDGGDEI